MLVKEHLQDMLCHKLWLKLKNRANHSEIVKTVLSLEIQSESGVEVKYDKRLKCVEYLCETVHSMTLHFNNKSKRCRYSARRVNISLAIYLRSKRSYNHLRGTCIIDSPHPMTLKKLHEIWNTYWDMIRISSSQSNHNHLHHMGAWCAISW